MKLSRYNVEINVGDKNILYNTLTRKYLIYCDDDKFLVNNVMNNLNQKKFEIKEAEIIKKMLLKGMIIDDKFDELDKIRFDEINTRFQEHIFYLVIQPTLECNFRCVYCYEKHKNICMDKSTEKSIIQLVEKISKKVDKIIVAWFGGEPTLKFYDIIRLTNIFKEICNKNGCVYNARITTNGYLFNKENIDKLKSLCIKNIQITLDGSKEYHDKQRPYIDGSGTFDIVKENILKIIDVGINVTMRINVSKDNYDSIPKVLDIIPYEKRKYVNLNMAGLFQDKGKINLFKLYKIAIDKGYIYYNTSNKMVLCEGGAKSSLTIGPNGNISVCSVASENGMKIGRIDKHGNIIIDNKSEYYKFHNTFVTDREMCRKCKQLPMCMGGCRYALYKNDKICNGLRPEGLSLEERIILHYYNDYKNKYIKEEDLI